ncbi:MAG: PAS domain S-box protein [Myxococcales bacterium]
MPPPTSNREESFAKTFRANPAPMVLSDKETGEFFDVNDRWVQLIGYSREELLGRTSKALGIWVDWGVRTHILGLYQRQGEARDVPARIRTRSGEVRDVLWSLELVQLDGREAMLSLLYDVTDLKLSQEALRTSEERFKRLLQNSNDIVTVLDASGVELAIHGPVEKMLGFTREELVGTRGFDYVDERDAETLARILADMLAEPGAVRRAEYRHRHKDGRWVSMEAVGTNLLHDPVVRGIVLNARDVTERNRLHEQLQQAMKMEAVGRLAGGVAHDFNNLLTAILGNLELVRMNLPAESAPVGGYLDEIERAADSAASLTRQLLSFSRRQIIEPKVLNLTELVTNLRNLLTRLLGEDVTLSMNLAKGLGMVRVDPGQFEQVLVNLAVNARDAMPKGGQLIIETANVELDDRYCQRSPGLSPGSYVQLAVSDTGTGMSPEVKQRLFEPFFTTKPVGRGTGLGLATAFGTVKQAGGHLEVYSELGVGTTFKVYLPRVERGPATSQQRAVGPAAQGGEQILLVEDDATVRALTAAFLRRLGYQVVAAGAPAEALALVESAATRFDLLMTDVVMPGMNGRELAERLLAQHPALRVLFTSGYTEDVVVHHGVIDAKVNFIGKPFTLLSLADKLREVLEGRGK